MRLWSNKTKRKSEPLVKDTNVQLHAIARQLRILKDRVAILESQSSTLRRDVNRHEKRWSRETIASDMNRGVEIAKQRLVEDSGDNGDDFDSYLESVGLSKREV